MALLPRISARLAAQHGALMPWSPVCLGAGIGAYFAAPVELTWSLLVTMACCAATVAALGLRLGLPWRYGFLAIALFVGGASIAGLRSWSVAAPVLEHRYYGPVEGRVVALDRSARGARRVTLDRVRLLNVSSTPDRVRIALHGAPGTEPRPGQRVMTTAFLGPPPGPVEPGGFDFRRYAWFDGLGAIGYTRVPLVLAAHSDGRVTVQSMRHTMSHAIRERLDGDIGAFAAAITSGDRSGMSAAATDALRHTNLSHLLAISGLHMGLLVAGVLVVVRTALNLIPAIGLRIPVRRIAACVALGAGACYLALSGGSISTERAFVMAAVMLVSLMFHRRAISLRAVAAAAIVVLSLRPESLLDPGFQMSFAATTALIAVYAELSRVTPPERSNQIWRSLLAPVAAVCVTSIVAGVATAPIAGAHFNRFASFGLLANLLAVPVMGLVIMPAALAAACLAPLGLEAPALWLMGQGLSWILMVAQEIASWPGGLRGIATPDAPVLPLLALGGAVLCLWRGPERLTGIAVILCGLWLWEQSARPTVLISTNAAIVGLMVDGKRALSRDSSAGFVAAVWLENDGSLQTQSDAAAAWRDRTTYIAQAPLPWGGRLWHVVGKRGQASFPGCDPNDIAVFSIDAPEGLPCRVHDPQTLERTGAVAYDVRGGERTARQFSGKRLWTEPNMNQERAERARSWMAQ